MKLFAANRFSSALANPAFRSMRTHNSTQQDQVSSLNRLKLTQEDMSLRVDIDCFCYVGDHNATPAALCRLVADILGSNSYTQTYVELHCVCTNKNSNFNATLQRLLDSTESIKSACLQAGNSSFKM